jgi:hypothetical protein
VSGLRRNTITSDDDRWIALVAAGSALAASFSGAAPTGATAIDAVILVLFAAFVVWAGASAAWWILAVGAAVATSAAAADFVVATVAAVAALAGALRIGATRANRPIWRAAIAGTIVQVILRIEWSPFFLSSALVGAAAIAPIVVNGVVRRQRHLRKRVYWGIAGLAALVVVAVGSMGAAAATARSDATGGYTGMLDGLEFVQDGRIPEAAEALHTAAADFERADARLSGPLSQLARLVPGLAQNRNAGSDVVGRAAASAGAAANALDVVDLDLLTVSGGVIDVFAFADLEAPLATLDETIADLDKALRDAESPWLVTPFATRLDTALDRAAQVAHQSKATAAAARLAPDILGADGLRRYFIAFVNSAEARGLSGLMGNWSELTIDKGRLKITANGRTNDLQRQALRTLELDAPQEYIDRYGSFGASVDGGVALKYWSNVTMTPDMPSVGNAMSQMYKQVTGRNVDGVFVIDAAGIAKLIEITGPVELPEIGFRIDSSNAEEFLTVEQYEFAENEREDLLTAVTDATIANVLEGELPPPQRMAPTLAPAVLNGHISAWAVRPEEQALFELVGMDASLPVIQTASTDAIAVSNNNASGNKIESFLQRTIEYRPVVDQSSGKATATLRIEFENTAPTTGFNDYVIGNLIDEPAGTNRMFVDVYTRMFVDRSVVDGVETSFARKPELGYWVATQGIDVASGATAVLEMELSGDLGPGGYQLVYRPQPLPNPDELIVEATKPDGSSILSFEGTLERRSVLDASGVEAWR